MNIESKKIVVCSYQVGDDTVFFVTGGTAHVGAIATAYQADEKKAHVSTYSLPGHKEEELATQLATTACLALGHTVVVIVGIHFHKPTKDEIEQIVTEAKQTFHDTLHQMTSIH